VRKLTLGVLLCSAGSLFASPIVGLFNTGVDSNGNPLIGTTVTDPHYVLISSPGAVNTNLLPVTYNCCYFSEDPSSGNGSSRWISVNSNGFSGPSGTYIFELAFSLSGFVPSSATISGLFSADNHATILLNGTPVPGSTDSFRSYSDFTFNSGFISETNKLDFVVVDDGEPMALRIDSLVGTATPVNTPEPSALAFMALGVGFFTARKLRSRSQAGL